MKAASSLILSFFCVAGAIADYPKEWDGVARSCAGYFSTWEMGKFSPTIKIYLWLEDIDGDGHTDIWGTSEWGQNGRLGLTWTPFIWTGEQYEPRDEAWQDVPLEVAQGTGNVVEIDYQRGYPQELLEAAGPQTDFAERAEALWEAKDFGALGSLGGTRGRLDPDDFAALLIQIELMAREDSFWPWQLSTLADKALKRGAKMEGEHFKAVYPALIERMEQVKALCEQRRSGQTLPENRTPPTFPGLPFLRALEEDGFFLRGLPLQDLKGSKP